MPNHYTNKLTINGTPEQIKTVQAFCKNGDSDFDFGKVIPIPQSIKVVGEISSKITHAVEMFRDVPYSTSPLVASMQEARRHKATLDTTDWEEEEFRQLNAALKAFDETGFMYWYDWNIANWGLKWNAYGFKSKKYLKDFPSNQIHFETANGGSKKVVEALSKLFLEVDFELAWASEDTGSGCGRVSFKNGAIINVFIPAGGSKEAYELSFELNPDCKEDYEWKHGSYTRKED
jgi:hypothetical protein